MFTWHFVGGIMLIAYRSLPTKTLFTIAISPYVGNLVACEHETWSHCFLSLSVAMLAITKSRFFLLIHDTPSSRTSCRFHPGGGFTINGSSSGIKKAAALDPPNGFSGSNSKSFSFCSGVICQPYRSWKSTSMRTCPL